MGLTIGKTLLKHKRVILFVSSLKKTVMKLRPQVQGPIDVGWLLTIYLQNNYLQYICKILKTFWCYFHVVWSCSRYGNYLLTSPGSREGRKKRKRKKTTKDEPGSKSHNEEENEEEKDEEKLRRPRLRDLEGRYDVSELLAPANTLTNPNNDRKSEL